MKFVLILKSKLVKIKQPLKLSIMTSSCSCVGRRINSIQLCVNTCMPVLSQGRQNITVTDLNPIIQQYDDRYCLNIE